MSEFIFGLVIGVCLAAGSIGYYAHKCDATPVYEAGYADGYAAR